MIDLTQDISPAFGDNASEFDLILPTQITSIDTLPNRIELGGKKFLLDNNHETAGIIYKTLIAALQSDWYRSLGNKSHVNFKNQLTQFFPWFSQLAITSKNQFTLLKDYESYRVNDKGLKPQSTGLKDIVNLLNHGKHADNIDRHAQVYLDLLLDNTVASIRDEREPTTLTGFFASMPWLREVLGERNFLMLESPKRLIDSFSITVAATLLFIIEAKQQTLSKIGSLSKPNLTNKKGQEKSFLLSQYSRELSLLLVNLTDGQPADNLTELLLIDTANANTRTALLAQWQQAVDSGYIPLIIKKDGKRQCYFRPPHIFAPEWLTCPSPIEEILFAWLCAWQTIQANDIGKLKRRDFIISKNQTGRPVSLQCLYYKGRSGYIQEPPLLDANQIEGRSLLAYLNYHPPEAHRLLKSNPMRSIKIVLNSHDPLFVRLLRLWQSPKIGQLVNRELNKRQCSAMFVRTFTKMAENCDEPYSSWSTRQKKQGQNSSISSYRNNINHYTPTKLFGLSAIKTSAVHSRTDYYRDGDLVNHNSHTAATEKRAYITDANKEWVNQNGRLTRMVLHDIEHYVYRPNLDFALRVCHDRLLRTRVVNTVNRGIANQNTIRINPISQIYLDPKNLDTDREPGDILVLDTPETVVNMLHYMSEAERQHILLIQHALPFFERTVLPMVEWMHCIIQHHITPTVTRKGQLDYEAIRSILPPHFHSELHGGVGA